MKATARKAWWRRAALAAGCGLALAAFGKAQGPRTAPAAREARGRSAATPSGSLLDRLPRVKAGGYAAALAAARARGAAGSADALWIELFYGDPAAQEAAETALRPSGAATTGAGGAMAAANQPELAFLQFLAAYSQGQDREMLEATLRLIQAAPEDVATELAVRALSGQLGNQGRALLDAVPTIEQALEQPLQDPTTSYMLGRALLAAVHAPGLALTEDQALRLSGRLAQWQLWGPFGKWQNLNFDREFPIEKAAAATYTDDDLIRKPQGFDSAGGAVDFPLDWNGQGVDFAVTYVRATAPTRVLLRLYTQASAQVAINGTTVLRNDRRSSYTTATATGALELAAGWNRIVVKLAGESPRDFDLMVRPTPGTELANAAEAPAGSTLAEAPQMLAAPPTLAAWSGRRLAGNSDDPVALWVDGTRRLQDEDSENARVALQKASVAAPNAAPVWLDLAEAYSQLPDASQSWAASQVETTTQHALQVSPHAVRAYDRLGHVYESEGKRTQAAEQYAQCAGKGFADCDWSEFHLAASQRWLPEAETALGHALTESGSDWNSIASGMEFYSSVGDAAKVAEWKRVLSTDPRASGALGAYDLRHGQAAEAEALFQTAIGFDPSAPEPRRQYLEALLLSGDLAKAQEAATAAEAAFPYNWQIAAEAGEIALRQNLRQGIAELRRTDFDRNILRHEADYLANDKFWRPWYHSAAEILRDAPGKAEYPNASSILVFDQMVSRINPDSSQDQYIHQIYRVLNAAGIEQLGDVKITGGSDLITVRTIKQDGRMLLPEKIANLDSISMPGLEAGDYIETEYVQHMPASEAIPGTIDNDEFFVFNSSTQPYHYSDYIVLTPPGYPLMVDQTHFPAAPTTTTLPDGDTAREWLVQRTRLLVTEPNMPPEQELVPKVWVSSQSSWDEISLYLADHLFDVQKTTPEMKQEAETLTTDQKSAVARADTVFDWVTTNIQPGEGSMLVPARQFFTDRDGNRMATFLALLSAAHVPYRLVMARGVTDDSSIKIPSLYQFQYPLVQVSAGAAPDSGTGSDAAAAGWYDLNNDFAQDRYIVPGIRGGLALVAGVTGSDAFTHVPTFSSDLDGVALTVTGTVADSGDATLHLDIEFRGPNGEQVREALANQPDSQLPQVYQQMVLANYPNATATGGKVENLADKRKPLVIAIDATVPSFVHVDGTAAGSGWDIGRLAGAVGLLARYAPLPFREEPLVIPGESFEQTEVKLTLPAQFGTASLPPAVNLSNPFGRFTSSFTQTGNTIEFQRLLDLKASLIPPSNYPAFRTFGEAVDNQDRLELTGTVGK